MLLLSVPPEVTTWIGPVAAPVGTVVVISVLETNVNAVVMPLKLTLLAPARSVPRILILVPAAPKPGSAATKGLNPTEKLNSVPAKLAPPVCAVP